jgi:hypothetical protein
MSRASEFGEAALQTYSNPDFEKGVNVGKFDNLANRVGTLLLCRSRSRQRETA